MTVSVANSVLSGLLSLPARALGAVLPAHVGDHDTFDPYEAAPVSKSELKKLFELDRASPWAPDQDMRASERRELDSMAMIRGALYADN
ncbi:hypothetical protein [Yoonia sp. 208BN28-4]|uniref:hypothetical protein n=1 Tax=Yoonia sp. 208BN28-4 TaxID=3126505 RepID=UPI0030A74C60